MIVTHYQTLPATMMTLTVTVTLINKKLKNMGGNFAGGGGIYQGKFDWWGFFGWDFSGWELS